jgi:phosphatidylglycerophosphate synthase
MSQISLYAIKPRFVAWLDGVVVSCASHGVGPNTVTLVAVPVALAASLALVAGTRWPAVWVAIAPLMLVLMSINAVDGALARRTGRSTPRGAPGFLLAPTWTVTAALVATLLAETVALVSWGAIGHRGLVGVMGKPDRALTLATGALAAAALGTTPFFYAYFTIALGASVAAVQRIAWVVRHAD